jgi:cyclic pyranopterin phosphate synthase
MNGHGVADDAGSTDRLTHVDEQGKAHMVDVTGKAATCRVAEARCTVRTVVDVSALLADRREASELLDSARYAGIMAAKQTPVLIPLCHSIRLDGVDVAITGTPRGFAVAAVVAIVERTGVEMEALTACTVAALVLVQALTGMDPGAFIDDLTLWRKSGGKSGSWERGADGQLPEAQI